MVEAKRSARRLIAGGRQARHRLAAMIGSAALACALAALSPTPGSAATTTMSYVGVWSGGTNYPVGAVVSYYNQTYFARTANVNSAPSPTNAAWRLIGTNGMDFKGAWDKTTTYQAGSVVRVGVQTYYSIQNANLNKKPATEPTFWTLIATTGNTLRSGAGAPTAAIGVDGDFYINKTTKVLFGPKTGGAWPANGAELIGPQGPKGDTGAQGVAGPAGPAGVEGQQGPMGVQGPMGETGQQGSQGPAGPALLTRTTFQFVSVPDPNATPATAATLTFVPPVSGTVLLRSRGFCNVNSGFIGFNEIDIDAAPSAAGAFLHGFGDWGVLRTPTEAVGALRQIGFTTETSLTVIARMPYAYSLFLKHSSDSGLLPANCSGSFTAELYNGSM